MPRPSPRIPSWTSCSAAIPGSRSSPARPAVDGWTSPCWSVPTVSGPRTASTRWNDNRSSDGQLPSWDEGSCPSLDLLSFQRVDAVRGPDTVGTLQHGEVHPSTAGRAGLDLDPGMAALQLVHEGIRGEGLGMHGWPTGPGAPGLCQSGQPAKIVIEVDSLPGVERHGARRDGVHGPGPKVGVEPPADLIDTTAPGAVEPGAGIRLVTAQPRFAWHQQLTATEPADAGVVALGHEPVVAAPG